MRTLLWIECGSCNGESMAILGAEGPGKGHWNLLDFLEENRVDLLYHPSLSAHQPRHVLGLFNQISRGERELTLLCVEGSIINGPSGSGMYDTFGGKPKRDLVRDLCDHAQFVFAMGTCAAYGGIPAAPPNPTESTGLQWSGDKPGGLLGPAWRSRSGQPVINLAGCAVDAITMIKAMTAALEGTSLGLDRYQKADNVGPCLSDEHGKKCGTRTKVGYSCYGCIAPRFPSDKGLFRHVPLTDGETCTPRQHG